MQPRGARGCRTSLKQRMRRLIGFLHQLLQLQHVLDSSAECTNCSKVRKKPNFSLAATTVSSILYADAVMT